MEKLINKNQLIDLVLYDFKRYPAHILKRMYRCLRNCPEELFFSIVEHELNYRLEIVRKNLYILKN